MPKCLSINRDQEKVQIDVSYNWKIGDPNQDGEGVKPGVRVPLIVDPPMTILPDVSVSIERYLVCRLFALSPTG